MKAIENLGFFHEEEYHMRYFCLEFGQPYCYFYVNQSDNTFHKSHKQSDIRGCAILEDR